MKKVIYSMIAISLFATSLFFQFVKLNFKNENFEKEYGPQFTKERLKYEYERLRDPKTGKIPSNIRAAELKFSQNLPGSVTNLFSKNDFLQSESWKQRGPFEVGGRTRALGLDIRNENIIIAGGVSGGMWKSTDAGFSWSKTSKYDQLHSVTCLVQDTRPGKQDNWYYGSGELYGNSASISGDGIFKSNDNGSTWVQIASTATLKPNSYDNAFDYIFNIAINPSAPDSVDEILVATAYNGIFRTINGGKTWAKVLGGNDRPITSDIAISEKGVYYATLAFNSGSNKGLYRSTNGYSWVNITPQNFATNYNRIVMGIAPSNENIVYFLGETPNNGIQTTNSQGDLLYHSLWKYEYISGDGKNNGGKWDDLSLNLPKNYPTRGQFNSQWGYDLEVKVRPDNPEIVFIGGTAMYRSVDGFKTPGGTSWIGGTCPFDDCEYFYRYPNHHADLHTFVFSRKDYNVLYTGSDGGIHKTIDNLAGTVNWLSLNNGYFTTQFYCIAIPHNEKSERIVGGLQDNGTLLSLTNNLNKAWENPTRGDGFWCQIPDYPNMYYTSINSTPQPKINIYRTVTDAVGKNVIQTRVDPIGGMDFIWNTPYTLDPNNTNIMYLAGGKMIWRNNDLSGIPLINSKDSTSINWDSLQYTRIDFKTAPSPGERITALEISKKPANVLYYGTSNGKVYRIDNANQGDPKPIYLNTNGLPLGGNTTCIAMDPEDAGNVFVAFSNYNVISIFNSKDYGNTWEAVSGNLEENLDGSGAGPQVNWVEIIKVNGKNVVFAGTSTGLYSAAFIHGNSTIWQQEGATTIGNVVIDHIDARLSDNYVAVGTHGAGVFTTNYTSVVGEMPIIPNLVSPVNLTNRVGATLDLEWEAQSITCSYELEVASDPDFKNILYTVNGIRNNKYKLTYLEDGFKEHYWRVRAISYLGMSEFSQAWKFTTQIGSPTLLLPTDGSKDLPINLTINWDKLFGATKYHLQVAKGLNFNNPIVDSILPYTSFEISNLENNKKYIWRVSAFDYDLEGNFSKQFSFWTTNGSGVNQESEEESVSVYPNPFTDNLQMNLNLESDSKIEISVYDLAGHKICNLENRNYTGGNHNLNFNLDYFYPGKYIIFIKINNKLIYKTINKM